MNKIDSMIVKAGVALDTQPSAELAVASSTGRRRQLTVWQRGMVTAEYAVGILSAVALAMVLYKVVTNQAVFDGLLRFVTELIGKFGQGI